MRAVAYNKLVVIIMCVRGVIAIYASQNPELLANYAQVYHNYNGACTAINLNYLNRW